MGRWPVLLRKWVGAESGCAMMFDGSPASGIVPSLAGILTAWVEEVQPELRYGWWLQRWVDLAGE